MNHKINFTPEQTAELAKMMSGELYDASANSTLLKLLGECQDRCHEYNQLRLSQHAERAAMMRQLLGSTGERFKILSPFMCDYGFNITIGENFFANAGLVILDEAPVTFGDNVFIAPNCGFYTAGHPLDVATRNACKQYSLPIVVGNNVWINPMRAYLKHTVVAPARSMDGDAATTELPSSMKVVIVEGTTGITSMEDVRGKMSAPANAYCF